MSREILANAFLKGLDAVEPRRLVRECGLLEKRPDLFISIGKAAPAMAMGLHDIWPDTEGIVVTTKEISDTVNLPSTMEVHGAGHPLPDEKGIEASERVADMLSHTRENQGIVLLLSGGGSSLLPSPKPPLSLEDLRIITQRLLLEGATILELNTVRRHIETLKAGGLLSATRARVASLIISDVVQNELWAVASGPTVPQGTIGRDARRILEKYGVPLDSRLEKALSREKHHSAGNNIVLADNGTAVEACAKYIERAFGRSVWIMPEPLVGDASEAGKRFAGLVRQHGLVVAGGETTVNVKGNGKGGRNQEMALAALHESCGTLLFASTDGVDGSTDSAGAFMDGDVKKKASGEGLDPLCYLANNDSNSFFSQTGGLFKTGPTGTNVCDIALGCSDELK